MARRRSATLQFNAIRLVGGLLPASLIEQIARQEAPGQKASDYGLPKNLRLQVAVDQAWVTARALWQEAKELSSRGEGTPWRVWFSSRLLREVFGWDDLTGCEPRRIEEALYPISHQAFGRKVPLVLTPVESELLDQGGKAYGQDGRRRSPHSCLQECLNADDSSDWGVLCNGTTLRLLHDNPALVKPAYVQVELGAILDGGLFDEFAVLWLLLQASRFQSDGEGHCRLDAWRELGQQSGERALNRLRDGVQSALEELGEGFLRHPANQELVRRLEDGELSTMDFFRQLLRLVYRLLFLCAAEDRTLLFPPGVPFAIQQVYREGYSLSRLRDLAIRSGAQEHQHSDLWKVQVLIFRELEKDTGSALGLPALGGLFNQDRCRDLDTAQLSNAALLAAVRAIGWFYDEQSQSRTRINYAAMNTEEFGSVYESLLELHPQVRSVGGGLRFSLGGVAGSERKTSGSYYTPEDLVRLLILSALLPVIADRLETARRLSKATTQQEQQQEQEAALLAIRVLDPACGSGHFLLAAARRLALELARLKAGDDEPSEELRRECLRKVVARCIYGVDKNPMAVELCKVALWIEAIEPGKPLGFLDAHIQCGDSLVGVFDPKVLDEGIPDGAYKPLTGDDKKVCASLKKKNQNFVVKGQADLFTFDAMGTALPSSTAFEDIAEEDLQEVRRKEKAYQAWRKDPAIQQELQRADACTAAFFLPKEEDRQDLVPLSQNLDAIKNGSVLSPKMADAVAKAAEDFRFLHWHLAFPEAMRAGGFDCVLGNPPWEVSQLNEVEFFSVLWPEIAKLSGASRKVAIKALENDAPQAWREFSIVKRSFECSNEFYRAGNYPLCAQGKVNTYQLFAEQSLKLIGPYGRAGIIVPTGIATDNGTRTFFDSIASGDKLVSIISFREIRKWFPGTDDRNSFCALTIGKNTGNCSLIFSVDSISELSDGRRYFALTKGDFILLNPNTRTCPVFRSEIDARLTKEIYERVGVLINESADPPVNPWKIKLLSELFNMTRSSTLFHEETSPSRMPLYEAKLVHIFDHRWSTFSGDGTTKSVTIEEKKNPDFEVRPRYWIDREEVISRIAIQGWSHRWLMGWRDVCRSGDVRTLIPGIIPLAGVGDKFLLILSRKSASKQACLYGCLASIVCDYVARQKLGGTSLKLFILKQIPVLAPDRFSEWQEEYIKTRVLELTYTAQDLKPWAEDLGYDGPPFRFDPDRRALLRAELDAFYAHLYGLSRDELRYILDPADVMGPDYPSETFRVLKNNEIRQFGEYRTQRLVLEAWDRLFGGG
jgi:hypothetical protein